MAESIGLTVSACVDTNAMYLPLGATQWEEEQQKTYLGERGGEGGVRGGKRREGRREGGKEEGYFECT